MERRRAMFLDAVIAIGGALVMFAAGVFLGAERERRRVRRLLRGTPALWRRTWWNGMPRYWR